MISNLDLDNLNVSMFPLQSKLAIQATKWLSESGLIIEVALLEGFCKQIPVKGLRLYVFVCSIELQLYNDNSTFHVRPPCIFIECDSCIHLLLDEISYQEYNLTEMIEELRDISVGYLTIRKLQEINSTVYFLRVRLVPFSKDVLVA